MTPEEFFAALDAAETEEDMQALAAHFTDGGQPALPFQPDIRLIGQDPTSPEEGQVAMAAANAWSRKLRWMAFRRRIRQGYGGPVIVSEGDSWFQYPILLRDVIDNLSKPFAIHSLGAAGDTLSNIRGMGEYRSAIADSNASVFLFSASGNDVLGGGNLGALLHAFRPGMELGDVLRTEAVAQMLDVIERDFQAIIADATATEPRLQIFFHGYDRPVPRRGGKWLGGPMAALRIPPGLQQIVVGHLIDLLNARLARVAARFPGRAHHVDCRGRVGGSAASWYDELHPRNPGYARVAALFQAQIAQAEEIAKPRAVPRMPFETAQEPITRVDRALALIDATDEAGASAAPPDHEAAGGHLSAMDLHILDEFRELQRDLDCPDKSRRLRARRHMVPQDDARAFERILGRSNLFPVNYLSRGARKAASVAKIQLFVRGEIPSGSGSGFLVGPGLMLTNNHVIASRDAARRARAVFNYQDDDRFQPMPVQTFEITDDVFFTSDRMALDFTFVSVRPDNEQGDTLDAFDPFILIEESGKAVKGEPVSIIQHPRGDRKSIALRDSSILGVKGDFIYYSTDTEPGSSGAPVLNDQWLPVALHHRSVPHPTNAGEWIANRGIRISQIFRVLREAAAAGDKDAKIVLRLIDGETEEIPQAPLDAPPTRRGEAGFMPGPQDAEDDLPVGVTEAMFSPDRWDGVAGYDPDFLGRPVPLPLPLDGRHVRELDGRPDLRYTHFSAVMHETRRLAMITACNIDGSRVRRLPRQGTWRLDPRIPAEAQIDNAAYVSNDYDRGHLVRRLAPMWGTEDEARRAMADTFHYTICAPQHARLNQRPWLELEDYLIDWAEERAARISVFTGPVFRADDPLYRGLVRVPADYWKVAVAETPASLRAVGYLHTQKNLIPDVLEAFGDYATHRVPLHVIAELSGLDLDPVQPFDVAGGGFETVAVRPVLGREDIGL